jgi:1-acyl-sn-glycerol-3-phosphate acyltransferase
MRRKFVEALYFIYRPVFTLLLIINTTILGILVIGTSYIDKRGNKVHYVGKFWSRLNLCLAGVRIRVHGFEQIQRNQPYIVMSNHQSHLDVWSLIGYLPLQLR